MDKCFSNSSDFRNQLKRDGFRAYEIPPGPHVSRSNNRCEFYKISLISGIGYVNFSGKTTPVHGSVFIVSKPGVPLAWEVYSDTITSYTCIFTEKFICECECPDWLDDNLFEHRGVAIRHVPPDKRKFLATVFHRMIAEQKTLYPFKDDLISSQINLLVHEAMRERQPETVAQFNQLHCGVGTLFLGLLEMQFPVEAQVIFWN